MATLNHALHAWEILSHAWIKTALQHVFYIILLNVKNVLAKIVTQILQTVLVLIYQLIYKFHKKMKLMDHVPIQSINTSGTIKVEKMNFHKIIIYALNNLVLDLMILPPV